MGSSHLSICLRLYLWEHHRKKGIHVYVVFSDKSIALCDNLSNSFFPVLIPKLPNTSYKERRRKQARDWSIVLSWTGCFGGLVNSRRYRVDQQIEIYNFRVVPDLQISKKVESLMIYMCLFVFVSLFCHEWGTLEVSEALVDTIQIRNSRSWILEWSQTFK